MENGSPVALYFDLLGVEDGYRMHQWSQSWLILTREPDWGVERAELARELGWRLRALGFGSGLLGGCSGADAD
jgi:hypothetical protein